MDKDYKIKVLWVDDEPNEDFMNETFEEGLDLENVTCVDDGVNKLKDPMSSYDAIILDGNCKITNDANEQPSLHALNQAISQLLQMRTDIPWFVYTAANYEGKDALEYMIAPRPWDDKRYYVKPVDRYVMYDHIKHAVENMPTTKVKRKYAEVLKTYSSPDFIQLLIDFENGNLAVQEGVPNTVRKILEWIMNFLNKKGVLPVLFTGTNLSECSVCLGMMKDFIPKYIQRSMHHCEELANEGSHGKKPDDNTTDGTSKLIAEGKAPYLNMSLVVDLLNIIHWCGTIPDDVERLRRESIKSYSSNKNISHIGKVVKDNGILKLDGIVLSVIDGSLQEGDLAVLVKGAGKRQDKYIKLAFL